MRKTMPLGSSLFVLQNNLEELSNDLRSTIPARISSELGHEAATQIALNLAAINNKDGNAIGTIEIDTGGPTVTVSNVGEQVKYLEYGTGATGAGSPHPRVSEAPYDYSGRLSWVYWNKWKGGYSTSRGLPAQAQVWKAAQTTKRRVRSVAKSILGRAVKSL